MKIFMILISPMIFFGVYLLVSGFINFHLAINAGEIFVFVDDKSVMMTVLVAAFLPFILLVPIAIFLKKKAPLKHAEYQGIFKIYATVFVVLGLVFWPLTVFFDEAYLKFYAAHNDYEFCAKQRGGNKSSDVLLFAKSAQDCEAFHDKDISVKDFRKELGKW